MKKPKIKLPKCTCDVQWKHDTNGSRGPFTASFVKGNPSCKVHADFVCICKQDPMTYEKVLSKNCPRYKTALKKALEEISHSH